MIFILEENNITISKLASYTTVLNKFSLEKSLGKINRLAPRKINLFIKMAYLLLYLTGLFFIIGAIVVIIII